MAERDIVWQRCDVDYDNELLIQLSHDDAAWLRDDDLRDASWACIIE